MLSKHLSQLIRSNFNHQPTESQEALIEGFGNYISSPLSDHLLVINGYAGTGKTSITSALVKTLGQLNIATVLMAPTGRAAKVLGGFANQNATTIHRKIYRQKSSTDGNGSFDINFNKHKDTIFIVDEVSLIANQPSENSLFGTGRLLDDLFNYVSQGNNCRIILVGDNAQLPPIGLVDSPALDIKYLEQFSFTVDYFQLIDVVRQTNSSGILTNATMLRELIINKEQLDIGIQFNTKNYADIVRIGGADLIEAISQSYDKYGIDETMIVCRSNKRTLLYNKGIRNSVLFREEELTTGDLLVIVKNNYFWLDKCDEIDFIANGDIAEVIKVRKYETLHGLRFANVTLRLVDHELIEIDVKIVMDSLNSEHPALSQNQQEELYRSVMADYADEKSKKAQFEKVRKDEYFNALQVKFAYASTCHKAQGGQWKVVFIDQGAAADQPLSLDYLKWLYTAITRATDKVYLINFPDNQFTI